MTNTKPDKPERQTKGTNERQPGTEGGPAGERQGFSDLSHMGKKSSETDKNSS